MFSEGGIFDKTYIVSDCNGQDIIMHGKYYSYVFNISVLTLLSVIFLAIPYLFRTLHRAFKWVSILGGSWIVAALAYQIIGVFMPDSLLFENMEEQWTNFKFASLFSIGIVLIILHETWNEQKS
jgi:hypothetical protein